MDGTEQEGMLRLAMVKKFVVSFLKGHGVCVTVSLN